jgi:cytochrome c
MRLAALCLAWLAGIVPLSAQDLRGHGGPVRALAVDAAGQIVSGSFDRRAIVWNGAVATRISGDHEGAVTAVLPLAQGRFATGGHDGRVMIWGEGPEPLYAQIWHPLPVGALAALGDGLASAGWEGRIALWPGMGMPQMIDAHQGQITGLVSYRDGLASVGADMSLRIWRTNGEMITQIDLPAPPSALATDGRALVVASPDGTLRIVEQDSTIREVAVSERPLLSVAVGEGRVAVGGTTGQVWLIDPQTLVASDAIETGQGPVWALAIKDGVLLTGGNDGLIRRWSLDGSALGQGAGAPDTTLMNPRGAQVFRACAVCHTLTPDDGARAGPTLHGIFGRRIASLPGYSYSQALRDMDIVWTAQTISELFEHGPHLYTPGSRMPDQRVPSEEDRRALIQFLETATR